MCIFFELNEMKKLLIVLLFVLTIGCLKSNDDVCDCRKVTYILSSEGEKDVIGFDSIGCVDEVVDVHIEDDTYYDIVCSE